MATVNVNRNLTDQFYRYKMPKLLAKVEGKGNGIKTVIVNMVDIAKALNRPPMYPTKYFGCVLGAQVNYDAKNDRYIVNGSHDATNLQNLLDGFIKTYVLCASCHNPETTLLVNQKKGTIGATCKACGHHGSISTQDKLSTYILKFPPDSQKEAGASVSKRKKKDKNDKNRKDGQNNDQHDSDELNGENGVHNNNNNNNDQNDDDGDWCDPKVLGEDPNDIALKKLTLNEDLDKPISQRMQIFYEFAKKKIGDNKVIDKSLQIEIVNEAERLDVRDKAIIAICEILFRDPLKIAETIKTNKNFFLRFTLNNKKCQKYLLRGFEMTVKEFPNELLPRVAVLLKLFYDEDIIDESIIIKWHDKKESSVKGELGNQIFEKAKKLVEWLKTAEEEDDGDDEDDENGGGDRNNNNEDDDEEVEIVYDERIRPDKIIEFEDEKKKNDMMKQASKNDDNDEQNEIDIDAI